MRLLQRFGVDDALIGDLVEQRQAGRSRVWLWWQLLVAVLAVVARDIAMQPIRFAIGLLLAGLLRYVTIGAWGAYEPWIDMTIARLFLDAVPLNRPPLLVAVACVNAILLAPVWVAIGFVVARVSRGAIPVFLALAVALLAPGVVRQLAHTISSDVVRWLLPVQLATFATTIGGFVVSAATGATIALHSRDSIA
jgi:hypothetical protein